SVTDPVANITAAANYAAHRYGSIDNVNSAY
ncbi:transglycosylase SLT domain-containing protein, partial [Streptomyces sp. NPDC002550]